MNRLIATHSIRVLGRELQVKSTSTPEHVALVEALVNEKLSEAVASVSTGDSQVIAILAMMNLAEAFVSAQKQLDEERRGSSERLRCLIDKLERQAD